MLLRIRFAVEPDLSELLLVVGADRVLVGVSTVNTPVTLSIYDAANAGARSRRSPFMSVQNEVS